MSSIDALFDRLRTENRKAFMPFVTAGDPDLDFTSAVIRELVARGSSMCEVGIPYSDPIADGPVIQASYTRALQKNIKLPLILDELGKVTKEVAAPVVTMVSYAIVYRHGLEKYVDDAIKSGVAGAIVPDLPVEESAKLANVAQERDFSLIQLVTPTTPQDRAIQIAETSTGFLYYVSVTGITGERTELPADLVDNVAWLRERSNLPICIGFGISKPEHISRLAPVADGFIVGSAVVRRIAEISEGADREQILKEIGDFAEQLVAAADSA